MIVHHLTDGGAVAHGTVVFGDHLDDFPEGQHADQFAVLHDHERADVFFRHRLHGHLELGFRCHGVERVALHVEDIADFHIASPRVRGAGLPGSDRARVVVMFMFRS